MVTSHFGPNVAQTAYLAVARRFPLKELAIRKLMKGSEAFRDMCADLAEADDALAKVPPRPPELSTARTLEWHELIDRLVAEIGDALREGERH